MLQTRVQRRPSSWRTSSSCHFALPIHDIIEGGALCQGAVMASIADWSVGSNDWYGTSIVRRSAPWYRHVRSSQAVEVKQRGGERTLNPWIFCILYFVCMLDVGARLEIGDTVRHDQQLGYSSVRHVTGTILLVISILMEEGLN
jgi:hypothetical protein